MEEKNKIPKGWNFRELIDFCIDSKRAIVDGPFGSNLKTEHFKTSGIPVINSSFVTDLFFKADKYVYVDDDLFQREIRSKVIPSDIIMAKIGARCGASAILPKAHPVSILSGNSLKISVNQEENSVEFVWYLLVKEYLKNNFKDCKSVGAQPSISIPHLKKIKFLKPPINEQKAIAKVLSTADAAIHATEKLIAQKELRKKWLMQQLFTGKKRLKGFKGEWKKCTAFDFLNQRNEQAPNNGSIPLFSLTIENGVTEKSDRYEREFLVKDKSIKNYKIVYPNDIVFNPANLRWGAIAKHTRTFKVLLSPIYEVLSVKKDFDINFISYLVSSPRQIAYYASILEGTLIERMAVKVEPFLATKYEIPNKEEQTAIAQVLQTADKEISLLKAKAEKLREQKKGLMQQLLTGKKRLNITL